MFANLNNVVWEFFDGLANGIDWVLLGQSISTGLTSLVDSLNFDSLAGMVTGFTTGIITAITQIDWEHIATTLLNGIQLVIQSVADAMMNSDNPLVVAFGKVLGAINDTINILKPSVEAIIDAVGPIIEAILPIISELLPPIADIINDVVLILLPPLVKLFSALMPPLIRLVDALLPVLEYVLKSVSEELAWVADVITTWVVPVFDILVGIVELVMNTIKIFAKAFRGEFSSFKDLFNELFRAWKTPINNIIGAIETLANSVIKGINSMIKSMNRLSFDVPDWVPGIGGKKFGFNIKELGTVKIPRLAQGAVIPPNKEFLAMLGDQKTGTNIEAPLETIKQALAEVMAEFGGGGREPIVLEVNGRVLAKVVWDEQEKRYKQTGKYSMA
jgi:phage-related protein